MLDVIAGLEESDLPGRNLHFAYLVFVFGKAEFETLRPLRRMPGKSTRRAQAVQFSETRLQPQFPDPPPFIGGSCGERVPVPSEYRQGAEQYRDRKIRHA